MDRLIAADVQFTLIIVRIALKIYHYLRSYLCPDNALKY